MRFQEQDEDCLLREDLREVKAEHFRINYSNELQKSKELFKSVKFDKKNLDGTSYFELKYFLTS
jgi:hypothetical protein